MPTTPTPEFNTLLAQAEDGDAEAQYQVGYAYRHGNPHYGVIINLGQAFNYFELATAQGHGNAQYNLGDMYQLGEYVGKNAEIGLLNMCKALDWLESDDHKDDAAAQCNMGFCYQYGGCGYGTNLQTAIKYFEKSANQGFAQAQLALGICYYFGEGIISVNSRELGVAKNPEEAFKYFKESADQGFAQAEYNIGVCYANGEGVTKNPEEAFKYFEKSAKQGYAQAQFRVGLCYKNGLGVHVDLVEAIHWFNKASEQGGIYEYVYPEIKNTLKEAVGITKEPDQDSQQNLDTQASQQISDTQEKLFKDLTKAQKDTENKIAELKQVQNDTDSKIVEFQNEKSTIVENAKKDLEKHGNFSLAVFTGVSIAITLAFIGIMASFSMSSFDGLRSELQAQFESPKLKIERIDALQKEVELLKTKLKAVEQKNNKPIPPNTN